MTARGNTKAGPSVVNTKNQNERSIHLGNAAVNLSAEDKRPRTTSVNAGKPTAVNKNPAIAISQFSPACCAISGGNIRLPAPRNNAKVIKPMAASSFLFK